MTIFSVRKALFLISKLEYEFHYFSNYLTEFFYAKQLLLSILGSIYFTYILEDYYCRRIKLQIVFFQAKGKWD